MGTNLLRLNNIIENIIIWGGFVYGKFVTKN